MHDEANSLTSRIRDEAVRLGFFKVGITRARALPGRENLDRWLQKGMHGEMAYMEQQARKRADPALVFEEARSLVILAINYYSRESHTNDPLRGKISRYGWGDDYHLVIKGRLRSLLDFIQGERPEALGLYYVDTGPVMEKVWGAETSLGWMGKHTNLISRDQGSWFFIGVILLNLELDYDAAEKDYCGSCTRCMTACPTGAIVAPYVVDARLCISYLTIELRGSIPRELRPLIGNRIYGCDDCQDVCPWNRFASETPEQGFHPREGNLMPELASLVDLTPDEFNRRFKNSPIRRARRDGFVRNVVVALGNSRRSEAVPALARALDDNSALVRAHAAWALGQVGNGDARRHLDQARSKERDPEVLAEIVQALKAVTSDK